MANFAVTDKIIEADTLANVLADAETYLETIDDSKTIHLCQVIKCGDDRFRIAILHGA